MTGHIVGHLPGRATAVTRGRDRYWYADGVWYAPRRGGYVVSRPAYGLVLHGLPAFATVVTFGAVSYYYANNVYYRPLPGNRYEVVHGELLVTSPPRVAHQDLAHRLTLAIGNWCHTNTGWRVQAPGGVRHWEVIEVRYV